MIDDYFRQYGFIVMFTVVAVIVPTSMIVASWLFSKVGLRPSKPSLVKNSVYECGMETLGGKWGQFNFRYYTFALLFLVFDVETIFIYPWAVHFKQLGLFAFLEMGVFILILVIGWLYAWRKRALEWE